MAALAELGVGEAAAAIRTGEITAEALGDALLTRCAAAASLNAFISLNPDAVRAAAQRVVALKRTVEQASKYELVINHKIAKALGFEIPRRCSPAPTRSLNEAGRVHRGWHCAFTERKIVGRSIVVVQVPLGAGASLDEVDRTCPSLMAIGLRHAQVNRQVRTACERHVVV
jgi:hypothetical protein